MNMVIIRTRAASRPRALPYPLDLPAAQQPAAQQPAAQQPAAQQPAAQQPALLPLSEGVPAQVEERTIIERRITIRADYQFMPDGTYAVTVPEGVRLLTPPVSGGHVGNERVQPLLAVSSSAGNAVQAPPHALLPGPLPAPIVSRRSGAPAPGKREEQRQGMSLLTLLLMCGAVVSMLSLVDVLRQSAASKEPAQTFMAAIGSFLTLFTGHDDEQPVAAQEAVAPVQLAPLGELLGPPSLTAEQINLILESYGSPAEGTGTAWLSAGQQTGIDPIYAVAFFVMESSAGTAPGWAGHKPDGSMTHNVGNIICAGYPSCHNRFRDYSSWEEGINDWFRLLDVEYIKGRGTLTVAQIIPIYAPSFENDVDGYVNTVNRLVETWRAAYPLSASVSAAAPSGQDGVPVESQARTARLLVTVQSISREGDQVRVVGTVQNTSAEAQVVPITAFTLRDSNGKIYGVDGGARATLAPNESTPLDLAVPVPAGRGLVLITSLQPDPPVEQVLFAAGQAGTSVPLALTGVVGASILTALNARNGALRTVTIAPGATWSFNATVGDPADIALVTVNSGGVPLDGGGWCDVAARYIQAARAAGMPQTAFRYYRHTDGVGMNIPGLGSGRGFGLTDVADDDAPLIWNVGGVAGFSAGRQDLEISNTTDRTLILQVQEDHAMLTVHATWGERD